MALRLVAVAALVSGCSPSLYGQWEGILTETGSCSDGTLISKGGLTSWSITQACGKLRILTAGRCEGYSAVQRGDVAIIDKRACPTTMQNGYTSEMTLIGGRASRDADTLHVMLSASYKVYNSTTSGTCDTTVDGTLLLKE